MAASLTPAARSIRSAVIATTSSGRGDWKPLLPLLFTLPPRYLPISPSKFPVTLKRAVMKEVREKAEITGEEVDESCLSSMKLLSEHEPTLRLTRAYCGNTGKVYFEVYPHVYELFKLKSSRDRSAFLKEMTDLVGPPERVIIPLPDVALTGRKPHPCMMITAAGLMEVAVKMKESSPEIIEVIRKLGEIVSSENILYEIRRADMAEPGSVVMGQTWNRAWGIEPMGSVVKDDKNVQKTSRQRDDSYAEVNRRMRSPEDTSGTGYYQHNKRHKGS